MDQNGRLRIAFAHIPDTRWSAGQYYLANLFFALRSLREAVQPQIVLLVPQDTMPVEYEKLASYVDVVLSQPAIDEKGILGGLLRKIRKIFELAMGKEHPLSSYLRKNKVDVFFTLGAPPTRFTLPYLSWIPDFQHHHYPEFFSEQEYQNRDRSFSRSARDAALVILSSRNALEDFIAFAPWAVDKARVLSFVAQINAVDSEYDPEAVCAKYNLPLRFVLLPNQFWRHKNHQTVIHALQKAVKTNPEITIVCTGNTTESRDSGYFNSLLSCISSVGVEEQMIILGLIDRNDMLLLMRQSIAVLQPSLFEGWNTTVEEVKSLGKKIILSDIPVHREQNPPAALYFPPMDVHALTEVLLEVFAHDDPVLANQLTTLAKKTLAARTVQYGEAFLEIALEKHEVK